MQWGLWNPSYLLIRCNTAAYETSCENKKKHEAGTKTRRHTMWQTDEKTWGRHKNTKTHHVANWWKNMRQAQKHEDTLCGKLMKKHEAGTKTRRHTMWQTDEKTWGRHKNMKTHYVANWWKNRRKNVHFEWRFMIIYLFTSQVFSPPGDRR